MSRARLDLWLFAAALVSSPALALEPLRVGNDAPSAATSCPLNYGMDHGLFARHGLDVDASEYFGTAKGQPALIGETVEVLIGAGSEMAFVVKGAPELGVAVISGAPSIMALVAAKDGPLRGLSDLRDRKLAITNSGGLTDWFSKQVMLREGISATRITIVSAGSSVNEAALLRTGQIDAAVMDVVSALALVDNGSSRMLQLGGPYVPDFVSNAIYANRSLIDKRPAVLRAFLDTWFEATSLLLRDDPYAVDCTIKRTGASPAVAAEAYAILKPDFSTDGRFPAKAMDVLAQSFVDTGVLTTRPEPATLFTEEFLPKH